MNGLTWHKPTALPDAETNVLVGLNVDGIRTSCEGYAGQYTVPLYAAPPAAPAPATSADYAMGYAEGFNDACKPAPVVPDALVEAVAKAIYWEWRRDAGYVPWVDGGNSFKQDDARKIARAVVSGASPVVWEPIIDEMDAVASKYAHKLALDLECVLSDYNGRWWDAAMNTIGGYRSAMNAIHERESPTHMGEPVLPKISSGVGK